MRIGTKMLVGYILLIVIPFLLFAVFVYVQLSDKLTTQYRLANQQNIEQLTVNLDAGLLKIESLYSVYQNNSALIDYLRGDELNDRDLIYSYLKEISPAFSFAALAEPQVESLTVYPKNQNKLLTVSGFKPYEQWKDELTEEEMQGLLPQKGLWKRKAGANGIPSLVYYHKIYNDTYSSDLGLLAISVKSSLLEDFVLSLRAMHPDNVVMLTDEKGNAVYRSPDNRSVRSNEAIGPALGDGDSASDRHRIVNAASIGRLGLTVIEINPRSSYYRLLIVNPWWVAGGGALLLLLSALYYAILSSLTKRMLLLSRHMRRVGPDSLGQPYAGPVGRDEFGFLITNYNAMIARMDELVNRVQRVELLKKDAEFKMLQAQIQPHFLYNTLETMRMLARSNGDPTVAEMAYSLGNLLRYSLAKKDDTTLGEEWDSVRQYVGIHLIRMPELRTELAFDESVAQVRCPRFIIQPLVENSIMHGLSRRRKDKRISIRLAESDGIATIEVSDNGAGIAEERLERLRQTLRGSLPHDEASNPDTGGIGLGNVVQRVKAYFGPRSGLTIDSVPGEGTVCKLSLDLEVRNRAESDDRR